MTGRPFTAAICQGGPCRARGLELLPQLAAVVRERPHGVLLRTGCLLQTRRCRPGAAHDSGGFLLIQPCNQQRQPRGAAIAVGPVLTAVDADAVARWLAGGTLDAAQLDTRLRPGWPLAPGNLDAAPRALRISDECG
jgi:hypothetical protein